MRRRYVVLLVFAILVAALFTWRLWPQSLSGLLPDDAYSFTSVSAGAMADIFEAGYPVFRHYRLEDKEQTAANELLDILKTSDYRPDFRNLLPWGKGSLVSGNDYDGRSVNISFYFVDGQTPRSFHVNFLGRSLVSISSEDGWSVYHATNPETLSALVEYIQTHGN